MPKPEVDSIEQILENFYQKVYEHAYRLGQEFPEEKALMHDPCNAEDKIEATSLLQDIIVKELYRSEAWLTYADTDYEVSSAGRVRRNGKILAQSSSNPKKDNWYRVVSISQKNVRVNVGVHRLVAHVFLPNPDNKPQVNHLDGNKTNNTVSNLAWATASENERHSFDVLGKVPALKGKGKKVEFICAQCKEPSIRSDWQMKVDQKYCSRECFYKSRIGKPRPQTSLQSKLKEKL